MRCYVSLRTRSLSRLQRLLWILGYLPQVARWLYLDALDRGRFNLAFYRGYAGLDAAELRQAARDDSAPLFRLFDGARAEVAAHRQAGEGVVLVTGSLDFIVERLAAELQADRLIAARLLESQGRFTGELVGPPLSGAEKARAVEKDAAEHDVDLHASSAYADSYSDLPLLESVGRPCAVNPDRKLKREALKRGWRIERW